MIIYSIISLIVLALAIYVLLPALTLSSVTLWMLIIAVFVIIAIPLFMKDSKSTFIPVVGAGGVFLIFLCICLFNCPLFRSHSYAEVFGEPAQEEMSEYTPTIETVPLMDRSTAELLMNRTMGTLVNEVSQFELGRSYQINYQGRAIRVAPLEYGEFFKYVNNSTTGIPAYITVDMQTQKTEIHRLEQGMQYSPSSFFGKDLLRHLWSKYPTALLGDPVFELDKEGTPLWVVPKITRTIGLFAGDDVEGVFCVDACTGDITYYKVGEIPEYIDNVYPASMLIEQYDDYGSYQNGFLNTLFSQKNVRVTTDGYNYIPQGDDIYLYTGVTSVGGDESNIGFIYVNMRTKEAQYYEQAGAEEYSAMSSAEGAVQHLGYTATFPLLLNIDGEPTYCVALKDAGGLVKMYGLINVEQYQIVVTAESISQCLQKYRTELRGTGQSITTDGSIKGMVTDIRSANIEGNTYWYLQVDDSQTYYEVSVSESKQAVLLDIGDMVELTPFGAEQDSIQGAVIVKVEKTDHLPITGTSELVPLREEQ